MKKLVITFLVFTMLLAPAISYSKKAIYVENKTTSSSNKPRRDSVLSNILVYVDDDNEDVCLLFTATFTMLHVSITQNGVTLDDDYLNVTANQIVAYDFSGYTVGDYDMTIETTGGEALEYTVTIEE